MKPSITFLLASLASMGLVHGKLVAWFPLDESSEANAIVTDLAGNTDAFTIGFDSDPEFSFLTREHPSARPNLGTSYLFTKGSGLEIEGTEAVQPTDKFTITFWTQPGTLDAFDRFLETQVTNTNAQDGIRIDMGTGNRVRVLIRDNNGASNTQFNHPITLRNDGTWYFVAFRYDSEGIDNAPFQLTVVEASDGPMDEATITANTAGPDTLNTGAIHFPHASTETLIGVENPGATGGNNLHAALDELAFYDNSDGNGVLSDAQLSDVYNFGPSGVELIRTFTADTNSVSPGNPATLSWEIVEPVESLVLDDGLGNVTDLIAMTQDGAGSLAVSPEATTSYQIRATRGVSVNVYTLKILAGAAPEITSFSSSNELVQTGESVVLSWQVTGADSLTLNPGDTDVSEEASMEVSPSETTTYTLAATNAFGTTMASVNVAVISGPRPAHRYVADHPDNDDTTWVDGVSNKNLSISGAFPEDLLIPSANTSLTKSYYTGGGLAGGNAGSYQFPEFTAEIWLRPDTLTSDHEVIFETGGGQNGIAALISNNGFRFIGSAQDERTLDVTIPLDGLFLDDFVQLVFSNSASNGTVDIAIRDTVGVVRTRSEVANVIMGGNGAVLFAWGSGGFGGDNNLGGRTEAADVTPEGLTGFAGEIAVVNIYDRLLEAAEIQAAFDAVATLGAPPAAFRVREITRNPADSTLTLSWDAIPGETYGAQFSNDLTEWFDLAGPFSATSETVTETLNVPPNQPQFFIRIGQR